MSTRPHDLPRYARPPVNEVVIGASFAKLRLSQAHIGLYWSTIRDEYVSQQEAPPIDTVVEWFDGSVFEGPAIDLNMPPLRRSWFIARQPQWLLQLQEDRIIHNWRRVNADDEYPHFEECLTRFGAAFASFRQFCEAEKLAPVDVGQLEVTYINHIYENAGWRNLADMSNVLPDLAWRGQSRKLPIPQSLTWQTSFRLPFDFARLHISIKSALRSSDRTQVLLCELTVRGKPKDLSMEDWLLNARSWCVFAFADITSEKTQLEAWGRK